MKLSPFPLHENSMDEALNVVAVRLLGAAGLNKKQPERMIARNNTLSVNSNKRYLFMNENSPF